RTSRRPASAGPRWCLAYMTDSRVRIAAGLVAFLVVFGLVLATINRVTPTPKGPRSSTYSTTPNGAAAYASVLARNGHPVRRLRTPIAKQSPNRAETLMILEPQAMDGKEARAIGRWVRDGGRLVVGDRGDVPWLKPILSAPPEWEPDGPVQRTVLVPTSETAGVRAVKTADHGAWHRLGGTLPFLGPADAPLALSARVG